MKPAERRYLALEPLIAVPYYTLVRKELEKLARQNGPGFTILDVGGRESPYTTGVQAEVTITDLPRESEVQHKLGLGVTAAVIEKVQQNRSNIKQVIFDDMTRTQITDTYDAVVAVEVLEHVPEDELFVQNVSRVLKPGGIFIMTTPNGHAVSNTNPDHQRHYRREQLHELLTRHFDSVDVHFAVRKNAIQYVAYRSARRFWPAAPLIFVCRLLNHYQSMRESNKTQSANTCNLVAIARK